MSEVYWGVIAIAFLILFGLTFPGGTRAVDRERAIAATRAVAASNDVVRPGLKLEPQAAPLTEPLDKATSDQLLARIEAQILDDPRAESVRVWSNEGRLLFSTSSEDHVGSAGGLNDTQIASAARGSASMQLATKTLAGDPLVDPALRSYLPIRSDGGSVVAVSEIDQSDAAVLADVHRQWLTFRLAFGVLAALAIGLLVLSLREPIAPIGAGVPFVSEMLPPGKSVLDDERAAELEEAGAHAKRRVALIEERLLETEEARRALEGELQRALTQLATAPKRAPAPAARAKRQPTEPVVASAPELTVVPDVEEAPAPPVPPARPDRAERAAPRKRVPEPVAEPAPKAMPIVVPEPVAAEPEPKPEPVIDIRPEPQPKPRRAPAPTEEPIAAAVERFAPENVFIPPKPRAAEPQAVVEDGQPETQPVSAEDPIVLPDIEDSEDHDDLVVVPDPLEPNGDAPQNGEATSDDESALEVLERLVEPVRSPAAPAPEVDLGEIRARLARTAARKKPGGTLEQGHATDPFEPGPPRD